MKNIVRILLILAFISGAGFFTLTSQWAFERLKADGQTLTSAPRNLENGKTLFAVGGCASCHMTPGQPARDVLGGGLALKTAFGTFYPPNISTDPENGLGKWSEADFIRALREGISPQGAHYYPAFPYTSYSRMTPDEVADLFAYIKTLPAASGKAPPHDLAFPFNIRRTLGVWKMLFMSNPTKTAEAAQTASWERGRHLVEGPGHCAECHSPRNLLGGIIASQRFAGGPDAEMKGWVPNITPAGEGVSDWTADDFAELLKTGFTPTFDAVGGSMADVVKNTAQLSDADRAAMAEYLKSLPPTIGPAKPAPKAK